MKTKKHIHLLAETVGLGYVEAGAGRPLLLLSGGAGADSMSELAEALAAKSRVVLPSHPGFDDEARPAWLTRIDQVALAYLAFVERLDLSSVVVVGNSIGGWIAAELAVHDSPRIAGVVLLNAVGIDMGSPGVEIPGPQNTKGEELLARGFHAAAAAAKLGPGAASESNQRTMQVYAGDPYMHDPGLRSRLTQVKTPTLVAWGESDRLLGLDYGKRYAASIPGARFETIPRAGHCPQIENADDTRQVVERFAATI